MRLGSRGVVAAATGACCVHAAPQYPSLKTVRDAIEAAPTSSGQQQQEQQQQQKQRPPKSGAHLQPIISPSILAADFANLAHELSRVETAGADWAHVDMFDGAWQPRGGRASQPVVEVAGLFVPVALPSAGTLRL